MAREFRCIHCGEYFSLSKEEQKDYEEGYFDIEPDACDFCMDNNLPDNHPDRIYEFSDADNGL